MVSLSTIFWINVIFFGIVGALRGWAKELVAASGLVLSIFTLNTFGPALLDVLGWADAAASPIDPNIILRRQFFLLSTLHLIIAFFSYQGPRLSPGVGNRLKRADNVQDKLLGWIIGSVNGYLLIGQIIAFMEYRVQRNPATASFDFIQLPYNMPYPFDPTVVTRPLDVATNAVYQYLPLSVLGGNALLLPLLMVILFLVILIVII
jgi:uncharacterized membrane protein required for colicin V production